MGKEEKHKCDVGKVHLEWDASPGIRERLRDAGLLMQGPHSETVKCAKKNSEQLMPLLTRMAAIGGKLPGVNNLREEVTCLFKSNQVTIDQDLIDATAWQLRTLSKFIKRKLQRKEVSKDPWTS